ncbi:NADPH oxidase 5-like [Amphibalanus amphitrite]|uniref:NADPH oxidase 5-like n=1 Tax=Amphibalanus amphitrite TaxID=1232801 RepID=UPI001C908EA1|nr:NADPH oxidase 5-like [Amphibalanus amphitrite]
MGKHIFQNNIALTVFYSFLVCINLATFSLTLYYRAAESDDWLVSVTSALGKILLLDTAVLPITVCRRILAWVQETPLFMVSPSNSHKSIHRTLSLTVCILAVVHSAAAMWSYFVDTENLAELYERPDQLQLNVSGFACLVVVLIIVITSLLRHHMSFLAFFLTHQLYVVLYGLMMVHAGRFWKYLVLPVCLWSAELLLRIVYSPRRSAIAEVTLLPSNVLVLVLERPPKMLFKPGDYVFVQIPKIGRFEWVKFTITSAPEQQDLITVHVHITNNWSFRLRNYFLQDVSFHYIPHRLHALESITVIQKVVKSWRNMFGGFQNIEVPMGKPRETRKERLQRNKVDAMKVEEKHLTLDVVLSEDDVTEPEPSAAVLLEKPSSSTPAASQAPAAAPPDPAASRRSLPGPAGASPTSSYTEYRQAGRRVEQEASQFTGFAEGYSVFTREYGKTLRFSTAAPPAGRQQFRKVKHHSLIPSLDQKDGSGGPQQPGPPLLPPLPAGAAPPADSRQRLPNIGSMQATAAPAAGEGTSIVSSMKRRRQAVDDDGDDTIEYADTIRVFIDGPYSYGGEKVGIFSARHAIIILVGPDVFPFAAVLQSILIRYRSEIVPCPNCACEFKMQLPSSFMNIRKVDFVWVNSDMEGYEWFLELLEDMDHYQRHRNLLENFLEFYLFKTGIKPMPSFTPLRRQLRQGRPRWNEVLDEIVGKSSGGVEVFFSGPRTVRKVVQKACTQAGLVFNCTNF